MITTAEQWLYQTGAREVLGIRAQSIASELIRCYSFYLSTGKWPFTGESPEDYTVFFHLFALRHGGSNPACYRWLLKNGEKIMGFRPVPPLPNSYCPICGALLTNGNLARRGRQERLSARGRAWCRQCAAMYD